MKDTLVIYNEKVSKLITTKQPISRLLFTTINQLVKLPTTSPCASSATDYEKFPCFSTKGAKFQQIFPFKVLELFFPCSCPCLLDSAQPGDVETDIQMTPVIRSS